MDAADYHKEIGSLYICRRSGTYHLVTDIIWATQTVFFEQLDNGNKWDQGLRGFLRDHQKVS